MEVFLKAVEGIVRFCGSLLFGRLSSACAHPQAESDKTLRRILSYAKNTEFGRTHRFAWVLGASSHKALMRRWNEAVPPSSYSDIEALVERHKNGEGDLLIPGHPLMYATTSGTTGKPKWLPVSRRYARSVYGRMTWIWGWEMMRAGARIFRGKLFYSVGAAVEGYAPDGTPCGSVSGYTRKRIPSFVDRFYAFPPCVDEITDPEARYYTMMRCALALKLSLIATANPSTVERLIEVAHKYYDELLSDIQHGTLSYKLKIDPGVRSQLEFRPEPARAFELRGKSSPAEWWPELQILCTWKSGNTALSSQRLKPAFPESMIHQEVGYFASECRFGLCMDDSDTTVPFPHMHFYEFVDEADLDSPRPEFLTLAQLQDGHRYCPYITTISGLYRYNMNDLVEVCGLFGKTPRIRFVQKINGIVSITGEKLSEQQFSQAVLDLRPQMPFFIGFADVQAGRYEFFFEDPHAAAVAQGIDSRLCKLNMEYAAKRSSGRLGAPKGVRLPEGSAQRYRAHLVAQGRRDAQFKWILLQQNDVELEFFRNLCAQGR